MLGDSPNVGDVAQEVFIRFFQSLENFQEKSKVSTYLSRIAINLSLNELKRQQRQSQRLFPFNQKVNAFDIEDKSANLKKLDTQDLLQKGLQILEPEFRSVIVLRLMDGYSVKETADILNIPIGTVASRLARGQKKLKSILEKI